MLDLGDTQLPEALLVAHLGEPERIEEPKGLASTELLRRLEERGLGRLPNGASSLRVGIVEVNGTELVDSSARVRSNRSKGASK